MEIEHLHTGDSLGVTDPPSRGSLSPAEPLPVGAVVRHVPISPDEHLLAGLRRRDERAFAELLDRYGGAMVRLAHVSLPDRNDVQDVVQEAWMGVFTGIDRFQERCSLKTWIFRILQYRIRSRLKRVHGAEPFSAVHQEIACDDPAVSPDRFLGADHHRWPFHWRVPPASWGESPEEALLSGEARAQLLQAVARLPAIQRSVITMRDIEGWTTKEVCEVLDLTPSNQRVLLHRARSKVRQVIEAYFRSE